MATTRRASLLVWMLICLVGLEGELAAQSNLRTWRSASGGFTVDAELVDVREDKVQLKKADGGELSVPISKLSLADVRYVQSVLKEARDALRETPGDSTPESAKAEADQPMPSAEELLGAEDRDGATMDDATADDGGDIAGIGNRNATRSPFAGMRDTRLVLGQVHAHELTFTHMLSPWLAQSRSGVSQQYRVVNMRTGKMTDFFAIEGHPSQLALSPDGSTMAAYVLGTDYKLVLYSTVTGRKQKEIPLERGASIQSLFFVSPQLLAATSFGVQNIAALYDTKSGKVAKTIQLESGFSRTFAISPDGKLLAIPNNATVALYDLKAGKLKDQLALVSASGERNISADDVAFCNDGTELAVVATASSKGELHVFSVRTGRPILKHSLTERPSSLQRPGQSSGPAVESIPGNKGYMLYGSAIVDREKGGPIWVDKADSNTQTPFRVLIDDKRQLCLTGDYQSLRFVMKTLPWNEIEKSKEIVSKGGTADDAGLPLVASANAKSARSIEVPANVKPYAGKAATPLRYAKPSSIPIDAKLGYSSTLHFSQSDPGKAVIAPGNVANTDDRTISLLDIQQGKVVKSVELQFGVHITDVSPGTKYLAGLSAKKDRVDIFDVQTGKQIVGFRPQLNNATYETLNLCRFVSDDLVITTTTGGEAIAWELPGLKARYRFKMTGQLFRFPVSPLFIHSSMQGWVVRQAKDGEVVGSLPGKSREGFEAFRMMHFRQDESACAAVVGYGPEQKLVTWDLLNGKRTYEMDLSNLAAARHALLRGLISGRSSREDRNAEPAQLPQADSVLWTGDDELLIRWGRNDAIRTTDNVMISPVVFSLLSLKDRRILWDYRIPIGMLLETTPEGQLWFTESTMPQRHVLVGANVPTDLARKEIAKAPPARLQIKPGEAVKVETGVIVSGDQLADGLLRDQVDKIIAENFDVAATKISDRASLKLNVLVTQTNLQAYRSRSTNTALLVSARLTDISDNVLWQRDRTIGLEIAEGSSAQELDKARRAQWTSALDWLKDTVQPLQIYEKWYYRGVGESLLSSQGEKLIELKVK